MNHVLQFGVTGQTLAHRTLYGVPVSATFEIFRDTDPDTGLAEFSGSAVVDTANTTITAAAGYAVVDPRTLIVASPSGFAVGRKYLLSGSGQSEWVEPVQIVGSTFTIRQNIAGSYLSGSTLQSTYVSAPVSNTWAVNITKISDDNSPWADYRLRWAITTATSTVVEYDGVDLSRRNIHGVDLTRIEARLPGLSDRIPLDYRADNGAGMIAEAYAALTVELLAFDIVLSATHNAAAIDELLIRRVRLILAEGGWTPASVEWSSFYEFAKSDYTSFLDQNFRSVAKHAITSQGGEADTRRATPLWVK